MFVFRKIWRALFSWNRWFWFPFLWSTWFSILPYYRRKSFRYHYVYWTEENLGRLWRIEGGWGSIFQKLSHLGGYQKFLKRWDIPEKGGWCRNGGLPLFDYFTVQLHLLCACGGSKVTVWINHAIFSSKSLYL